MHIQTISYSPPKMRGNFKRLMVEPISKSESMTTEGLIVPTDIGKICEMGIASFTDPESTIQVGSLVLYNKIDRTTNEHLDTVSVDGKKYDVLYENEVWSVDNMPYNRIFVEPLSDLQINEAGLMLPANVKGITQKGKIFRAPDNYSVKAGDHIEYRKQERGLYPTVDIEGVRYDVLFESDIYTVNDHVSPFRIIVKIDIAQQSIKRRTSETGLIKSSLFLHMLHNLQFGEVLDIGEEAQKNYPELKKGDIAILHHTVEADSQAYRILKKEYSKYDHNISTYEYRIINSFGPENREIFGRIVNRKEMILMPFGKNVFLEWNFDTLYKTKGAGELMVDFDTNIDNCHDIYALKSTLDKKRDEGYGKAMAKIRGLKEVLSRTDPVLHKDKFDTHESELKQAMKEAAKVGAWLTENHLLSCKLLGTAERVVTTYKELYPINILDKKFLIAYNDLIIAKTTQTEMNTPKLTPLDNRLIVQPIEEIVETELIVPAGAKEKPQKGLVISVGPGKGDKPMVAKEGDTVLYLKGSGIAIPGEENLLIMTEGVDTIAIYTTVD